MKDLREPEAVASLSARTGHENSSSFEYLFDPAVNIPPLIGLKLVQIFVVL
jgi:hypothetical protein